MTTLYLVRHGQSEANIKHIIQGQSDYPLTSLGKTEAALAAEYLQQVNFDAVYTSDLTRALNTADILTGLQHPKAEPLEALREVFLGPLEGKTRQAAIEDYPELEHRSFVTSGIPGTETFDSISQRCLELLNHWRERHSNETILAVSHGGFISIFLMYLITGDGWHQWNRIFRIDNTGITKIVFDELGQASIYFSNSTSHLQQLS